MSETRRLFVALSLVVLAAAGAPAQEKPPEKPPASVPTKELDEKVFKVLRPVINTGASLYNNGDPAGCYRLFQGALMTIQPLLDHRPDVQALIDKGLKDAEARPTMFDKALALREVLDNVRAALRKGAPPPMPEAKKPLWDRLGGEPAVRAVVQDVIRRVLNDPKINFERSGKYALDDKDLTALEQRVVEFISAATGGPLKYSGRSMKASHKDMGITNAEFKAFKEAVRAALKKHNVPAKEADELLAIVEATRADIVQENKEEPEELVKPRPKEPPLWERLGGEKAVRAAVRAALTAAANDPAVDFTRGGVFTLDPEGWAHLETLLVEWISAATGGPLPYRGKDLKTAHARMGISAGEFDRFIGHVTAALKKQGVAPKAAKDLEAVLRETQKAIVER
jgi:hemoglobin